MGRCVICGKLQMHENVTLHRFPRDKTLCQEWVKIIGWGGWIPASYNVLCSDHFIEDSFCSYDSRVRKRLKSGALHTICTKITLEPHRDISEMNSTTANSAKLPGGLCNLEESVGENCNEISSNKENIPIGACNNYTTPKKEIRNISGVATPRSKVLHDHRYDNSPRSAKKRLDIIQSKLDSTQMKFKITRQQLRLLKKS
ncbi:THAP domain-containing protein 2-like [Belonocnema kinseyi]|uniref:THAP domain-containing protein 2-like n=1 Tax=Belonocnema kinseyi TaxID=2817044 RepID=UPI00143D4429|nr:THAP domain-containing protein 2-like [Belonocnema kinseyi]XP_033217900.1 THAP domain-containing protein 2-like [Belonocnema kinseyi]